MTLVVQKFGGTSVESLERIQAVAKKIAASKETGKDLIIVVSAMGNSTDELTQLAKKLSAKAPQRELDMLLATGEQVSIALLSIALNELGVPALAMTGPQVGIVTESSHGRARILEIRTERIKNKISEGQVVVIAGFQGTSLGADGTAEITTLGRGGSDTSAVALATALDADVCEIYTDVPGVLTTDPRKVDNAQLMETISCDEMLELASLGAAVLHPRAVEIARNYGVKLVVKSSWTNDSGTTLTSTNRRELGRDGLELGKPVDGLELVDNQAVIGLSHIPDKPGIAANLFEKLSEGGVNVDLIIQSTHAEKSNDITFTISKEDLIKTQILCKEYISKIGGKLSFQSDMTKLSIRGAGIMGRPGIAAKLFETLSRGSINLRVIATSEVKVSCLIDAKFGSKALRVVGEAFDLNENQIQTNPNISGIGEPEVRGVAMDPYQAQLSVCKVPHKPGTAASLFSALADAGICVDAIVQSERTHSDGSRDISFTLKKEDRDKADQALAPLINQWDSSSIQEGAPITRISAVGAGMPATAGTAGRMFRAIADSNINIEMIATSEIRISCLVRQNDGINALQAVHTAFKLGDKKVLSS